jgi:penicillin-insensitive murein DD-endopeptidase
MIVGKVRSEVSGSSGERGRGAQSAAFRRVSVRLARAGGALTWAGSLLLLGGCLAFPAREATSLGRANRGVLLHGVALSAAPAPDAGYVLARPADDTRWGTPTMVAMLERAARAVRSAYPGGTPLRIGDVSARFGGNHTRHGSHQSGRDVDVLFFLTTAAGEALSSSGFYAFDRRGVSAAARQPGAPLASFDTARNWAFVRALLADPEALVQWIFCADGVKARLLAHAAGAEPDRELVVRAAWVLHEPSYGSPHDDHFHIRIACSARDRALGCVDDGPTWPWLRNEHEKPLVPAGGADDDDALLAFLLGD